MAQIGAVMKWRWSLEEESRKEKSRDKEGVPRMTPGKFRRRGLRHPSPVSIVVLFYLFNRISISVI